MKYRKASILALTLAVALVIGATTAFAASAQPDSTPDSLLISGDDDSIVTSSYGQIVDKDDNVLTTKVQ